jgi:hypothetical protein
MPDDDAMTKLEIREVVARARVRAAARDLKESLVVAVAATAEERPWSIPVVGFCAGFLSTFFIPERRHDAGSNGHGRW